MMRKFYDYGIPWEEAADAINPVVSAEERFFEELERMEQEMLRAEQAERQIAGIRQALTRTQFRRSGFTMQRECLWSRLLLQKE